MRQFPFRARSKETSVDNGEMPERERERGRFSARGNRVKTGKVSHGATPIYLCPA